MKTWLFLQSFQKKKNNIKQVLVKQILHSPVFMCLCNICVVHSHNTRCAFSVSFSKRNLVWSEWHFVIVAFSAHSTKLLARIKSGLSLQRVGEGACVCTCISVHLKLLAWKFICGYRSFERACVLIYESVCGLKYAFKVSFCWGAGVWHPMALP